MSQPIETEIAPYVAGSAWIVTASSYLVDRFVPECEILAMPGKTVQGGRLVARWCAQSAGQPLGWRRILSRRPTHPLVIKDRPIFDARCRTPQNWAHFLNNHLPILFRLCALCNLDPGEVLVVTPADTPDYITAAAAMFGLEICATDAPVEGAVLDYEAKPWTGIRAARADWVHTPVVQERLIRGLATLPGPVDPLPRRVFLSRSDTRRLSNEAEIEALLAPYGYSKIYPERLSVADQMRLFLQAERIVAIHGAGLAPLLYRPPGAELQLVELMPCGHMTDVYRVIAEQIGCGWIGVRGRIKPAYVEAAYLAEERFDAFSLDDFEVDPVSLERALEMLDDLNGGQTT